MHGRFDDPTLMQGHGGLAVEEQILFLIISTIKQAIIKIKLAAKVGHYKFCLVLNK